MKTVELLAPAKNFECGKAAILCGADALYVGAPAFSARKAAGVSLDEIKTLIDLAHFYRVKVYVALNTILNDQEIDQVSPLIHELYAAGADALIIQDMGLLELDLPPIRLFASTQTHNTTVEKVRFLESVGFPRVILARELSLAEIRQIRQQTELELEVFVHGSLCVCYSGQCYLSSVNGGRSANRGECAQPCRKLYSLEDETGRTLVKDKPLLSVRDLNSSEYLAELLDSGVSSFKIEGRLKDVDYVKNIVTFYRQALDALMPARGLSRPSSGRVSVGFEPNPEKTFNRGYTNYLMGPAVPSLPALSAKSVGEFVGTVSRVGPDFFEMDSVLPLHNADGICFLLEDSRFAGTQVNQVVGRKIYPDKQFPLQPGTRIYRNHDHEFLKKLQQARLTRKISVQLQLAFRGETLILSAEDEDGVHASVSLAWRGDKAREPQVVRERTREQLAKLGDTDFIATRIDLPESFDIFLPVGVINDIRRQLISQLSVQRQLFYYREETPFVKNGVPYLDTVLDFSANISNDKARGFYQRHGVKQLDSALEVGGRTNGGPVMTTRLCLRKEIGLCSKETPAGAEPVLLLRDELGKRYRLSFDCGRCVMEIREA